MKGKSEAIACKKNILDQKSSFYVLFIFKEPSDNQYVNIMITQWKKQIKTNVNAHVLLPWYVAKLLFN